MTIAAILFAIISAVALIGWRRTNVIVQRERIRAENSELSCAYLEDALANKNNGGDIMGGEGQTKKKDGDGTKDDN